MPHSKILNAWASVRRVCTDTRKLQPGDLFFALRGEHFNGNEFAAGALEAGAGLAVIDDPAFDTGDERLVRVPDALRALQDLALHERRSWSIPVIALTGSNGKTTTKELIVAALSSARKVHYTRGNLNNHIGVPLTILALEPGAEIAVIEMGANKPGDIRELVDIALPTHCLITNIGLAHLELMGGQDGVERTKGEMFDFARAHQCTVFVNEKDERVLRQSQDIVPRITCGLLTSDYFIAGLHQHARGMEVTMASRHWTQSHTFATSLIGTHNADNVAHAVAVACEMGISIPAIQMGIAAYEPRMNRTQFVQGPGYTILLDAYNANPSSVEAVIRNIFAMDYGRIALVLGDMFELGDHSEAQHRALGELVGQLPVSKVVGIGREMKKMLEECPHVPQAWFASAELAVDHIRAELEGADLVLIKGSRGMALEKLLPGLQV